MPPTASGDQTPAADPPGDLQRLLHAHVSRRTVVQALALTPLVMAALKAPPARSVARVEILPAGTAPRSIPFPASHLGVRWQGSEAATVEARLSSDKKEIGVRRRRIGVRSSHLTLAVDVGSYWRDGATVTDRI